MRKSCYEAIADYFARIYLIINNIPFNLPQGQETINFVVQISRIEALHDDITDIVADIDEKGFLQEPNLFSSFLSDQDKKYIVDAYKGKPIPLSVEKVKSIFPQAYRQYKKIADKRINEVASIPGMNIHQFLEFGFYHYPVYLSSHFTPESKEKKNIAISSIGYLAVQKKCLAVIKEFQKLIISNLSKSFLEKQLSQLLHYVYCHQLYQAGFPNNIIAQIINVNPSTVFRWLNHKTLPMSIRHLKEKPINNIDCKWFLLGVFSQADTIKDGYLQIIRSKSILDTISNRIKPSKNIIFKTKKYHYLRYYNARLTRVVQKMKHDLLNELKNANTIEKNEYYQGLDVVKKKNIPVKMQQNNITNKYSQYAKSLVIRYFGHQKKEFWDEFPSLLYLCLSTMKKNSQQKIKYSILNYFKKYFHSISQTKIHNQDTYDIERIADEKDELEKIENFDNQRLAKVLNALKNRNKSQYLALALRFGFMDGKEHTLTDDLSLRLFDYGVNYKNKPLSKSQTYQLLQSSLVQLRALFK